MSEYPIYDGKLEIRARGGKNILSGRFPYNATATVKNVGTTRKERFAPGSMSWQTREFQKLQVKLADTIKSSIDAARKKLLIEQLEDGLERRNTHLLIRAFLRPGHSGYADWKSVCEAYAGGGGD